MRRRRLARCTTPPAFVSAFPTTWKRPRAGRRRLLPAAGFLLSAAASIASVREPRRVVTLSPSLTEIVFAAGGGGRLVGVSSNSDYPPEAARLPSVGGPSLDLERVVALAPDLVLAMSDGTAPSAVEALRSRGVRVLVVETGTLASVVSAIESIGRTLDLKRPADAAAEALRERLARVESQRTRRSPRAVCLIWPDPPQAAGAGTFLDDILRRAGAVNVIRSRGWPVISLEFLLTAPADVVVFPDSSDVRDSFNRAFDRGPLARMPALAFNRRIAIPSELLIRPGPRAVEALEILSGRLAGMFP